MTAYLGVDLGASRTRAIIGTGDGSVRARATTRTPDGPDGGAVTEAVIDLIQDVCHADGTDPADVFAAGIGTFGPLDRAAGAVVQPPNVDVERISLTEPVADLVDGDVYLHNDAATGAIGERYFAPGSPENLVYLTISTGIGAGAIVDGTVLSGERGNAAEVGHFELEPDGPALCGCGGHGHWEGYASGGNLPRYARYLHSRNHRETDLDLATASSAAIYDAAPDDPLADLVLEHATEWHLQGIRLVLHAYDPAVLTIGGAVALRNTEKVIAPIRERLHPDGVTDLPTVKEPAHGEDAVVMGALASALTGGSGEPGPE